MEYLTDQHISEITTLMKAKGVEMEELLYDLVDHVCCMVEEKMEQGKNYPSALEESISSFGNNGIRHIQEETTFLLTKNLLAMKKTMHIIGIAATIMVLVGSIFKVLHYPGAGILYLSGGILLTYLFLPLLATLKVKQKLGSLRTWASVVGIVSGFILVHGIFFKVMHWPMANVLMKSGGALLLFVFLPLSIYVAIKHKAVRSNTLISLVLSIAGFSILFVLVNLGNSKVVDNAILNIQYTINKDVSELRNNNTTILVNIPDSVRTAELNKLIELSESIDVLAGNLSFKLAKSHHPKLTEEQLHVILAEDLRAISDDMGDLGVLRKNEELVQLLHQIEEYQQLYEKITGVSSQITINQDNMDYYLTSHQRNFPLGIVIQDLSLLNLQVQRSQQSVLHYYKGRVS